MIMSDSIERAIFVETVDYALYFRRKRSMSSDESDCGEAACEGQKSWKLKCISLKYFYSNRSHFVHKFKIV